MAQGDVSLLSVSALPEPLRERWWIPSPSLLDSIEPGLAQAKVLAAESDPGGAVSPRPVWIAVTARDGDRVVGTITTSGLDHDGFRAGDRLEAPLDSIFDLALLDAGGAPRLNEERARFALGKRVLVGLTFQSPAGELIEQRQFAGWLVSVDPTQGLELELRGGSRYNLPPDVRSLEEAPPGEYRLRSTGEVERDPDYIYSSTVTREDAPL